MSKRTMCLAVVLACATTSAVAETGDDVKINVGLKLWNQKGVITAAPSVGPVNEASATSTNSIVSVAARYKDYFVSGSHLFKDRFDFRGTNNFNFAQDRAETDIGVGWYFIPQVALMLGYKTVDSDSHMMNGSTCSTKVTLPMLGLMGVTSFSPSVFGYANGAVAVGGKSEDNHCRGAGDMYSGHPKYSNFEIGVGYRIDNNMQVTAGYRQQNFKYDYNVATLLVSGYDKEVGKGLVIGASYTF